LLIGLFGAGGHRASANPTVSLSDRAHAGPQF
jgi:hypothetical protein